MAPQWRLAPVAVGAWLAAALGTLTPVRVTMSCAVAAAVLALACRRGPLGMRILAAAAAGIAIAAGSAAWHVHRLTTGDVPRLAATNADVVLALRLVRDPAPAPSTPGLMIVDATVTAVEDGRWQPADSPVLVLSYGSGWAGLLPGQRVMLRARLSRPRPGDEVAAVLDARGPPSLLGRPAWWQRAAGRVRTALRGAASGLPGDERGLLPSLVDGDESGVPPSLQATMRATGLTHLEAVSGENVSVTLAVVLMLARGAGLRRRGRVVVCAVMLAGFVVLARPSPSVLRAAVMGSVALLGLLLGRRAAAVPALSVAVFALVVINPFLARSIGFVLSVVATAALVTVAPGWTRRLERWLPHPVAVAIAVPAAAQVACTPVLLLAFGQLTPYAVPANLAAGLAVVPATVLGVACAAVATGSAPAGALLAWLAAAPTGWIAQVSRGFAGLPAAGLTASPGLGTLLAMSMVVLAVGALMLSRRRDILAAWHR